MQPEWLQTFRNDLKESVCAASAERDLKDAAEKDAADKEALRQANGETVSAVTSTQPLQNQAGQQHAANGETVSAVGSTQPLQSQEGQPLAASGETISTVEQTQTGQPQAATVETISTGDANETAPTRPDWLKVGGIVVGCATSTRKDTTECIARCLNCLQNM